jgi:hypothetical protein
MSNRVDVELKEEDNEEHEQQWYAESTEGKVLVSSSCCTCTFYKSMQSQDNVFHHSIFEEYFVM